MGIPHRLILTALMLVFTPLTGRGQDADYHILLTNDDGVESPGLEALAEALTAVGQVHVVAPCGQRSGSSMAIDLRAVLEVRSVGAHRCVDTTPAGTVLLALTALAPEGGFDLVVSGINQGANVGTASHMSGTVGAAMMGALYDTPAVAASFGASSRDFGYAAQFVAGFVQEMKSRSEPAGVVYSINIPQATEEATAGVRVVPMGGMQLTFAYAEEATDTGVRYRPQIGFTTEAPDGSDTAAFLENMITVTPLRFDWTDHDGVERVNEWALSHRVGG